MSLAELPFSLTRRPLDLDSFFRNDGALRVADAQRVLRLRERLGSATADAVGAITGGGQVRDASHRRLLRSLRRGDPTELAAIDPEVLDGARAQGAALDAVVASAGALLEAEAELEQCYADELARKRSMLRVLFAEHDELRWSVRSLGPEVEQSRERMVQHDGVPDKRYRKHELVFTRIASRAGTKTSPLSRFNRIEIRRADDELGFEMLPTFFSFHNASLFELFEAVALSDDGIDVFAWRVRPYTSVLEGDVIVAYTEEWNSPKASVYRTRDSAVRIPASPLLRAVIDSEHPWTVGRLVAELGLDAPRARALVRKLADLGVLQLHRMPSDRSDLCAAVAERIRDSVTAAGGSHPSLGACADALLALSARLASVNREPSSDGLDLIARDLFALRHAWAARGDRDPGDLVYEDYVMRGSDTAPIGGDLRDDLAALLALWSLFDVNIRVQLEFNAAIHATAPRPMPPTDAEFFRLAADASLKYRSFWSAPWEAIATDNSAVNALDALRGRFVEGLLQGAGGDEVRIDPALVRALAEELPTEVAALSASYTILYMEHDDGIVVNRFFPGHQAFLSRFLRHSTIPASHRTLFDRFYADDDHEVADIYETYGFNATARAEPPVSRRVVSVYTRDRDADENYERVIDLDRSTVDVSRPRVLIRTPDDELVQPIVTSNLIRTFYPAYTAFTASLYGNVNHLMECSLPFLARLEPDRVVATPRVSFGRVVIERRRWFVPTGLLGVDRAVSDHERFIQLGRKLDELGLPHRFYFHARRAQFDGERVRSLSNEFAKPQYFDLEHPLLINVLANALASATTLMVVEPLPDRPGAEEHVREFMIRPGGPR